MIEVEVRLSDGAFHRAFIRSINTDSLILCFENDWQTQQQVSYNSCRLCPTASGSLPANCSFRSREMRQIYQVTQAPTYQVNDVVEAWISVNIPGVVQPVYAWHECRLESMRSEFVVVSKISNPDSKDIIAVDEMRPVNNKPPLDPMCFKTKCIDVPLDMRKYVNSFNLCKVIEKHLKDTALCDYDEENGTIVVTSPYRQSLSRADLINSDSYWRDMRHKIILQSKAQQNQFPSANNEENIQSNISPNDYVDVFKVPLHLMGLAIGSKGANIARARKMSGIKTIIVNEPDPTSEAEQTVAIKIVADDEDSASYARAILEFLEDTYNVPASIVGVVIGKHGVNIEEIVKRSGVVRICVGSPEDSTNPNMEYQPDSSTSSILNPTQLTVPFHFLGTAESIENAKFMLEMSIKSHQEIESLRENLATMRASSERGGNYDYSSGGRGRVNYYRGGRGTTRGRGGRGSRGGGGHQNGYADNQHPHEDSHQPLQTADEESVPMSHRARGRGGRSGRGVGRVDHRQYQDNDNDSPGNFNDNDFSTRGGDEGTSNSHSSADAHNVEAAQMTNGTENNVGTRGKKAESGGAKKKGRSSQRRNRPAQLVN